jgi:hypothetical protein
MKQQRSESEQNGERQRAVGVRTPRWISLVALYASSAVLGFAAASVRADESGYVIVLIAVLNILAYLIARTFDSREFSGLLRDNRDKRQFVLRYTRLQVDRINLEIQVRRVDPSHFPSDALDHPLEDGEDKEPWADRLVELERLEDRQARLALTQSAVEQIQEDRLREAYDEHLDEILDDDSRAWLEAGQRGAAQLWRAE